MLCIYICIIIHAYLILGTIFFKKNNPECMIILPHTICAELFFRCFFLFLFFKKLNQLQNMAYFSF